MIIHNPSVVNRLINSSFGGIITSGLRSFAGTTKNYSTRAMPAFAIMFDCSSKVNAVACSLPNGTNST